MATYGHLVLLVDEVNISAEGEFFLRKALETAPLALQVGQESSDGQRLVAWALYGWLVWLVEPLPNDAD